MASTTTPNMSLIVPGIGTEAGPQYATDINNSLTILDAHNHASGSGVQITPSGLNINSALSFGGNNLTALNQAVFNGNISGSPSNLGIYSNGTDLFFTDGTGSAVQITKSHAVNAGTGSITGLPSTPTGGAGVAWNNTLSTFQFLADSGATGSGGNIDVGSITIRYPGSYPSPTGNYIQLQAPTSLATGYSITLPAANALGSTGVLTYNTSNQMGSVTYDAVGQNMTSVGANAIANTRTRSTSTSASLGNVGLSSTINLSAFNITPGPTALTNATFSITVSGTKPVVFRIVPSLSGGTSLFYIDGTGTPTATIYLYRGGSPLQGVAILGPWTVSPSQRGLPFSLDFYDFPAAGTYTYALYATGTSSATLTMQSFVFMGYEI